MEAYFIQKLHTRGHLMPVYHSLEKIMEIEKVVFFLVLPTYFLCCKTNSNTFLGNSKTRYCLMGNIIEGVISSNKNIWKDQFYSFKVNLEKIVQLIITDIYNSVTNNCAKGDTLTRKEFTNTCDSSLSFAERSKSTVAYKNILKNTQDSVPLNQSTEDQFSRSKVIEDFKPVSIQTKNSLAREEIKGNYDEDELVQYDEPTFRLSPRKTIQSASRGSKKKRAKSRKSSQSKRLRQSKLRMSGHRLYNEDAEISLCCETNEVKIKRKQKPITGKGITEFYNHLVDSDFTNISSSPVTFGKASRFNDCKESSPGPGHYNPSRNRVSNYKISKTYSEITKKKGLKKRLDYFN
ncbi:unnamed protein product [Moneuplotes crassus]|uniref:Uncharacterized protein n=1 Tax=Euplotes crassus TaxID=5936 RepID=A0AAD1XH50_EUPCR|nr:unnamed protein product [Moneuplotes crassus]